MKELNKHFDNVHEIAVSEIEGSKGCQFLCERLLPPFDTLEKSQIENWIERLSNSLSKKCWRSRDFKSSCKMHGNHLLYIAETGDAPEIINVGFPMMEIPHTFENIGRLAKNSTFMLPQLIENISNASTDDNPYFECTDLFYCYLSDFGLEISDDQLIANADASRLLVDSIALLAMIKSWRTVDPAPTANVYFCTSSGSYTFGRPTCIQKIAG